MSKKGRDSYVRAPTEIRTCVSAQLLLVFRSMIALGFLAALLFSGMVVMVAGLRNAPEGYESGTGFHSVWCNRSPEIKNIVCIWEHQPKPHGPNDHSELSAAA